MGGGQLATTPGGLRLSYRAARADSYTNAQIDDYQGLPRSRFHWRPPLSLRVTARFSHPTDQLRGTAGFGFWNDPFAMTGARLPTLPRAIWFFFNSADAPLKLALETPGYGWRAATIDGWRAPFLLLSPTIPAALILLRWRWLYRRAWPLAQWAMGVAEALIDVDLTVWHTYEIYWGARQAIFRVDGADLFTTGRSPRGPLGLVLWIDNQGMVVTPWQLPSHRLLSVEHEQWLEVGKVMITT
ncbi:MAG: hypothetical protein DCC55_10380 [Chloroflexi bacterium]|nr:MAG: hypothetical protein DCC55_10380 [Chloroflexota bacterium]